MQEQEFEEKDIEGVIRWLKINDPKNANRETAISLLQDLRSGFHNMAHNNPELLYKLKQDLGDKKATDPTRTTS
jgi:hypothetical protein